MIVIIIPVILYSLLVYGLIRLSKHKLKNEGEEKIKKNKKRIIRYSSILFPILFICYMIFLFGLSFEEHHVSKGTFMWYATMDNKTIRKFPLIEPDGEAYYASLGGDHPTIAGGWKISYASKKDMEDLTPIILSYLEDSGFAIEEVLENGKQWQTFDKSETNRVYTGHSKKGEGLDLLFYNDMEGRACLSCVIVN